MVCLRSMPTVPPPVVCTLWQAHSAASARAEAAGFATFVNAVMPVSIMPRLRDQPRTHEPCTPKRLFSALYRIRVRGPHLRVDLEPLPQAVPRPRGVRADAGARAIHGRDGDRLLAVQPLVAALEEPAVRLRARRSPDRARGVRVSSRLR